jgi:hypothetical protein
MTFAQTQRTCLQACGHEHSQEIESGFLEERPWDGQLSAKHILTRLV